MITTWKWLHDFHTISQQKFQLYAQILIFISTPHKKLPDYPYTCKHTKKHTLGFPKWSSFIIQEITWESLDDDFLPTLCSNLDLHLQPHIKFTKLPVRLQTHDKQHSTSFTTRSPSIIQEIARRSPSIKMSTLYPNLDLHITRTAKSPD